MRKLANVLLLITLFAAFVSAVNYEEHVINFSVSEVPVLINVSANINTTSLLPGYEYSYNLSMKWAIPDNSLRNINADQIKVFIKVHPKANVTNVYFRDPVLGLNQTARYFTLKCIIQNASCANGSTLSRSTQVHYFLTPGANISLEQLMITAQLLPFANDSEIIHVNETLREANLTLTDLNGTGTDTTNETSVLEAAYQLFDDGDYNTSLLLAEGIVAMRSELPTPTPTATPAQGGEWLPQIDPILFGEILLILLLVLLFFALNHDRSKKHPTN